MKTTSEIKDLARQAYRDQQNQDTEGGCGEPIGFIAGYIEGFKACEAKMLADIFEDYQCYVDTLEGFTPHEYVMTKKAFTAGAMSQAKRSAERIKQLEDAFRIHLPPLFDDNCEGCRSSYRISKQVLFNQLKQGGEK